MAALKKELLYMLLGDGRTLNFKQILQFFNNFTKPHLCQENVNTCTV